MADTATDRLNATGDSRDSNMGTNKRGLSWWSVLRAEVTCFVYFVASLVWLIVLAILLITGIIVAVDHSFIWGLIIVVATMYAMERTGL